LVFPENGGRAEASWIAPRWMLPPVESMALRETDRCRKGAGHWRKKAW
jgi:hypothetical protein